jgi:hypothetical protein
MMGKKASANGFFQAFFLHFLNTLRTGGGNLGKITQIAQNPANIRANILA